MAVYKIFDRSEKSADPEHIKNEDNYMYFEISLMNDEKLMLIIVADGMGALSEPEKASKHAVEAFALKIQELLLGYYMKREYSHYSLTSNAGILADLMKKAVVYANQQVYEKGNEYEATGTTLSVVGILGSYAVVANVGDSPVYYYNQELNELMLVSELHTEAELDVKNGLYRRGSDIYYSKDHLLTKSMGRREILPEEDVYVDVIGYINSGDMILAGSDGAFGRMGEDEIYDIISGKDEYRVLKELFARAREDKDDDQTAVLYKAR